MDHSNKSIENLIEKTQAYVNTTLTLYKYEAVYKTAEIGAELAAKLALVIVSIMSSLFISVGLSLWIGQQLGEAYYGFFIVGCVYLCIAFVLYIFREKWVKNPVSNFIINTMNTKNVS